MIDATFVKSITDLAQVETFVVDGKTYSTEPLYLVREPLPLQPPQPQQPVALPIPSHIAVTTLTGFAELVRQRVEKFDTSDYVIQVVNEGEVALVKKYSDECGRRLKLIVAKPVPFEKYQYDKFLDQETFIVSINALFAATPDKDYILGIASNITDNATSVSEDNGISQKLTVKVGMQLADTITVRPQIDLAPYRIFPECQQPISKFVFRARGGKDPSFMLKEADGGIWKITAINEVRRVLATFALEGLEIIA
jgi:hypothetical protein